MHRFHVACGFGVSSSFIRFFVFHPTPRTKTTKKTVGCHRFYSCAIHHHHHRPFSLHSLNKKRTTRDERKEEKGQVKTEEKKEEQRLPLTLIKTAHQHSDEAPVFPQQRRSLHSPTHSTCASTDYSVEMRRRHARPRHSGRRFGFAVHEGGAGAVGQSAGNCHQLAFQTQNGTNDLV